MSLEVLGRAGWATLGHSRYKGKLGETWAALGEEKSRRLTLRESLVRRMTSCVSQSHSLLWETGKQGVASVFTLHLHAIRL